MSDTKTIWLPWEGRGDWVLGTRTIVTGGDGDLPLDLADDDDRPLAEGDGDLPLNPRLKAKMPGGQLDGGDDLATAVLISLFTDRQATADDALPDDTGDRRGWWGDLGALHPIGSRLWLLDRAKETPETLARARDYIVEALQWLIDDGVAARVAVETEWTRPGMLGARITVHRSDGRTAALSYEWVWS